MKLKLFLAVLLVLVVLISGCAKQQAVTKEVYRELHIKNETLVVNFEKTDKGILPKIYDRIKEQINSKYMNELSTVALGLRKYYPVIFSMQKSDNIIEALVYYATSVTSTSAMGSGVNYKLILINFTLNGSLISSRDFSVCSDFTNMLNDVVKTSPYNIRLRSIVSKYYGSNFAYCSDNFYCTVAVGPRSIRYYKSRGGEPKWISEKRKAYWLERAKDYPELPSYIAVVKLLGLHTQIKKFSFIFGLEYPEKTVYGAFHTDCTFDFYKNLTIAHEEKCIPYYHGVFYMCNSSLECQIYELGCCDGVMYSNECFTRQAGCTGQYIKGPCEEYSCPNVDYINCMPIVPLGNKPYCTWPYYTQSYYSWIKENCNVSFS